MSSWTRLASSDNVPKNRVIVMAPKPIVSAVLRSGLGNRFFQILAGLGYAERTGKQFVFFEKQMLDNFHTGPKMTKDILMSTFPQIKIYRGHVNWNQYHEDPERFYDGIDIPAIDGSVLLHGYFQNEANFPQNYRELFKIPKPPTEITRFNDAEIDWKNTFFIHIRKGDYIDSEYDIDLTTYYKSAISAIQERFPECLFLIFSDQPDKVTIDGLTNSIIVPANIGTWETLYLMSRCVGAICANSTFSWFGAYGIRGDGPVYMPSVWKKGMISNPVPKWAVTLPV